MSAWNGRVPEWELGFVAFNLGSPLLGTSLGTSKSSGSLPQFSPRDFEGFTVPGAPVSCAYVPFYSPATASEREASLFTPPATPVITSAYSLAQLQFLEMSLQGQWKDLETFLKASAHEVGEFKLLLNSPLNWSDDSLSALVPRPDSPECSRSPIYAAWYFAQLNTDPSPSLKVVLLYLSIIYANSPETPSLKILEVLDAARLWGPAGLATKYSYLEPSVSDGSPCFLSSTMADCLKAHEVPDPMKATILRRIDPFSASISVAVRTPAGGEASLPFRVAAANPESCSPPVSSDPRAAVSVR